MLIKYQFLQSYIKTIIALIFGLIVYAIFLVSQNHNPIEIYYNMISQTLGNSYGIGEVVIRSAPLILLAVATCITSKAGLVNVGGEGQFAMGALFSTSSAIYLMKDMSGIIGIPIMAVAGIVGGMFWAFIAAGLKVRANMNETIVTVIMNYIAYFAVSYFVYGSLKDPESFNWPMSPQISEKLELPSVINTVSIAIIIAVVIAISVWIILKKSKWGYMLRVIGANPIAALHAGYNVSKTQVIAFVISGGIAGLAGMLEIAGVEGRLRTNTGVNFGYLGFLAAWMAWNNPLAAIFTACVIGLINISGNVLEISSGLPSSSVGILMAIILLSILWKGKGEKK